MPVFKIKPMEGDEKMKVVHRNLFLLLFSDLSDHTSETNTKSMVGQNLSTHDLIAVGAIASLVHNVGAYSRAWVRSMFHRGLEFVTALFE